LRNVREQLEKADIPIFTTTIVERAAYRDIFDYGGLLSGLPPGSVSNLDRARANAGHFAAEVIARLRADAGHARADAKAGAA
jgi:chromosome partitioning protein